MDVASSVDCGTGQDADGAVGGLGLVWMWCRRMGSRAAGGCCRIKATPGKPREGGEEEEMERGGREECTLEDGSRGRLEVAVVSSRF